MTEQQLPVLPSAYELVMVDEADSVLVDEARTPLIIAEPSDDTLILSAVSSINMLLDVEVREECDLLVEQLSHHSATNLVIDLGAVDHFGSVILELMVDLWKHIKTGTGKFVVCNVPAVGKQVLRVTNLDTLWTILPSREEALMFMHS